MGVAGRVRSTIDSVGVTWDVVVDGVCVDGGAVATGVVQGSDV